MRFIRQPGPPAAERIVQVAARGRAFEFTAQAGLTLLAAVHRGFAEAGFSGGVLSLIDVVCRPFAYVMPALSTTGEQAAFYSDVFRPPGATVIERGAMTLGERDGAPFFHCHALWREADGRSSGGHILPDETILAEPFTARAFGLDGAGFLAAADGETNFKLFGPVARTALLGADLPPAFALRLRPNQDITTALEDFCRLHGIARARLHGGVGSIVGAHYEDGRRVEPFATEMALLAGLVAPDEHGAPRAALDVALVDYTGAISQGRLMRGENAVLMTFEVVLEPL